MKPQQQRINIELDQGQAEGTYSNFVLVGHTPSELVLDFARMMPGMQKAKVFSRIIMTPSHAKMLLKSLEDNIKKYEKQYGEIKLHGHESKNIGFGSPVTDEESA
ncbi:MAG: DUF3467 domain-containing protein [FCB group bacterium]|nr:DUF3467 domain-containing protein [FCB group bacterium]